MSDLTFYIFMSLMVIIPIINFIITPFLDNYTKPDGDESIIISFLFFGIFLLPFKNKIKKSRYLDYYNNELYILKRSYYIAKITSSEEIKIKNKISKLERKIKLIHLNKF